jgi:pilus assembly protein CpaB
MAATALTPARALRQPRRLDLRALVGVLLMLAATGGAIVAWSAAENTRPVVVATHDLAPGTILSESDLAVRRVRIDDSMYGAAITDTDLTSLVGRQLAEPVHAQQMLVQAQVSARPTVPAGQLVMTIPVRADTAAGGHVRSGDVVQVLATTSKGKPESKTTVILPQASVYDVGRDQQQIPVGSGASATTDEAAVNWVSLVVTQDQAVTLANARWNSDLDVALAPGARP